MAKVFVTGATGFIGKEMVKQLVKSGHTVLALVRSLEKWNQFLSTLPSVEKVNCIALIGDLRKERLGLSQSDYEQLLDANIIIHAGVPMDITLEESQAREVILEGTNRLLAVAKELHEQKNLQKLIHIVGYMSPYRDESGQLTTNVFEKNDDFSHAGGYEKYKFLADLLLRQEALRSGLPLIVVNPSTVVGPRHTGSTEQTDGVGLVVSSMRRGKFPVLPWGKEWWLPLIALDDLAILLVGIVEAEETNHQTYYALHGRDTTLSFPEFIQLLAKELRMKAPTTRVPLTWIKALLRWGGSKIMGVPANSMDFIVEKEYPLLPFQQIMEQKGIGAYDTATFIPRVVADLDYRLSAGQTRVPLPFQRERLGDLAAYKKEGKGKTWVLLHGLFSEMSDLIPLAEHLKDDEVWLLDLPGFGRSPYHHQEAGKMEGYIHSVVKAIQEIPSPIHLVGHSFGGYLANEVAKRVPDKIENLYLLQPPLHAPKYPALQVLLGKIPALFEGTLQKLFTPSRLENVFLEQGVFQSKNEIPSHYLEKVHNLMQSPRIRKTHTELLGFFMKDFTGMEWGRLPVPTRVIWGARDKMYHLSRGIEAMLAQSHIEVEQLDVGHHFPISHPELAAKALRADEKTAHK